MHTFRVPLAFVAALVLAAACLTCSSDRTAPKTRGNTEPASLQERHGSTGPDSEKKVAVTRALERMPLYFIENRGQLDSRVAYYVQGRDTTLYFTAEGMTLVQTEQRHGENGAAGRLEKASLGRGIPQAPDPGSRWVVKLDFGGGNPNPKIAAADPTPAVVSYFKGRQADWKAGLSTYGSITYSDLWPGIDLVYSGTADRLKYTFLVKPGADPDQVRLAYRGARDVRLNDAGQLEVETPAGVLQDDRPYAYQEVEGRRVEIRAGYSLDRAPAGGPHRYGFALGSYDRSKPLVLDPAVLVYCGYIGGSGRERGHGIAGDRSGNAYVTGYTDSSAATGFPVTVGPDLTYNGNRDAFVAKVKADGTGLVYCGYIGGASQDIGYAIAGDSSGNAYITGPTDSNQDTFPVPVGPHLTYNGGSFVAKINAAGTALIYCGYIGGSRSFGYGIAVDRSGNAYVTGSTEGEGLPVTVGPYLTHHVGVDAFVAKVKADGTGFVYCGYIGGSGSDFGYGIAVDSSGNAYVTGKTNSRQDTFPVTVGPDLISNGGKEAFVAKVHAAGTALVYCGYIGGSNGDSGNGIAVDSSGNAYVTGFTESTEDTFPVTVGPDLTFNAAFDAADAFVAKVNAAGTALVYCGYIGVSEGYGIAVDSSGNAYVTGSASSNNFPCPDLTTIKGGTFVAKVNATGTALVYCGEIGGVQGNGIAVDSAGNAYVAGYTTTSQPATVGPDATFNATAAAFVAKIGTGGPSPPPSPTSVTVPVAASIHGAGGSFFHSDVRVLNQSSSSPVTVTAKYHCFSPPCGSSPQTFTLSPREMRVFDDMIAVTFNAPESGGAIEFASAGSLVVTSRLYTPSRPLPTNGMGVPGIPESQALSGAVVTSLSHSANPSQGFRSNIGAYNANDVAQTLTFTVFNGGGTELGHATAFVAARTAVQVSNIFNVIGVTTDVSHAYCVVRGDQNLPLPVYAGVIDNQSQDLAFVQGQANTRAAGADRATIPVAASIHGAGGSFFHTDATVLNTSTSASANVTMRYRCFSGSCGNSPQGVTLAPREMRAFDDIIASLFAAPESGGAIQVDSDQPVVVGSRLYTPSRPAPTNGMGVPGLPESGAPTKGVLTSLSYSAASAAGFRSNVGAYNANDVAQAVTFTLFDPAGTLLGQVSANAPARSSVQGSNVFAAAGFTRDVPNAYCIVHGDQSLPLLVYAGVIDNQSQDLAFIRGETDQ